MQVASILRFEIWGFLLLLASTLAFQMLTRRINLSGLLSRKGQSTATSPERIQLLLATILVSARYLSDLVHAPVNSLPNISPEWLYVLGGSSAVYAAGKAVTTFWTNTKVSEQMK